MANKLIFISENEIRERLNPQELMTAMEAALIALSCGEAIQPLRSVIAIPEHNAWFGLMPAVYRDVIGAKLVTVFPGNAQKNLDTHQGLIQLFERTTGVPLAILDARSITAWRTAAVSALATRELANPDAHALAILGSGVQARTHWEMLRLVRNFDEVRIWSRTPENADRFATEVSAKAINARVMDAEAAVRGADVVVTVTHSSEPVLWGEWLKPGAHVNAVGAVGLHARELDDAAMQQSAIVVESAEAAAKESGEIEHARVSIYAELGQILSQTRPKPKEHNSVYKSLGVAVEDVAAARAIYLKLNPPPADS
jgi:thiomorpholine-carboxylate dehydrogenase